jgi:hypothetical protein
MKKSIRPPENWQDFETLCKRLFGEIWGCSMTIKKNGRLGQSQLGVDIYGKPKNENDYWGIQCKGKDNYLDTKLTEKEIENEIEKAKNFEPKLKTFIITTTCPKDVNVERFIRERDQENSANNSFNIVLYCWQDLADLIEENRDTYNWYINEIQFKDKFDVTVNINSKNGDGILKPKFQKSIKSYIVKKTASKLDTYNTISQALLTAQPLGGIFGSQRINHGWVKIKVRIKNSGSVVLEDWKFWLEFDENIKKVDDNFTKDIFAYQEASKYRTTWAYEKDNAVLYKPINNHPLIQKDSKDFSCYCIPNYDAEFVKIKWHLLARNFDREGEIEFKVEPQYAEKKESFFVDNEDEIRTKIEIGDYITTK